MFILQWNVMCTHVFLQVEILKFLLQDYSQQLAASQDVLVQSGKEFFGRGTFPSRPSPLGAWRR
jgi:hypothetical protein